MTAAEAMARLDEIVRDRPEASRYAAADALYEAALRGLMDVPIPATTLYRWVVKWATLPEARGRVGPR